MIAVIRGKNVYLDTNILIYLMEGYETHWQNLKTLGESIQTGEAKIVTSEMTLCEILVKPFKDGNLKAVQTYRDFLEDDSFIELKPTSREIYLKASLYRAEFGLKMPDAIHVATAVHTDCEVFITNDHRIRGPRSLAVVNLDGKSLSSPA